MNDEEEEPGIGLTARQRRVAQLQVDYFGESWAADSGMTKAELLDLLRWMRDRKEWSDRLKTAGAFSAIGIVLSAVGYVIAEAGAIWIRSRGGN